MLSYKTLNRAIRTSMMLGKPSSVPYTSRPLRFSANPMLREKNWISEPTLNIIEDRRAAPLRGDKPEVKRLTRERSRARDLDQGRYWDAKAAAIESAVARQDQHTVFRELRICKPGLNNQSTTVQAEDGTRITNIKDCLCRWKYHFSDPLNEPCDATDAQLQRDAEQATPDADSHTDLVTSREVEFTISQTPHQHTNQDQIV